MRNQHTSPHNTPPYNTPPSTLCPGSTNARRPVMRDVKGKTWDRCDVFLADGLEITGYLDTTHGKRIYFPFKDKWRCVRIDMQLHELVRPYTVDSVDMVNRVRFGVDEER